MSLAHLTALFNQQIQDWGQNAVIYRPNVGTTKYIIKVAKLNRAARRDLLEGDVTQLSGWWDLSKQSLEGAGFPTPPEPGDRIIVNDQVYTLEDPVDPLFSGPDTIGWRVRATG